MISMRQPSVPPSVMANGMHGAQTVAAIDEDANSAVFDTSLHSYSDADAGKKGG
jgi:hypothetical protein